MGSLQDREVPPQLLLYLSQACYLPLGKAIFISVGPGTSMSFQKWQFCFPLPTPIFALFCPPSLSSMYENLWEEE